MFRFIADTYDRIIVALLVIEYVFVNLIFTTYTQNIVILKDLSAPLFSMLILFFWVVGDLAKYGRWQLPKHGIVPATVAALLFWLISVIIGPTTSFGIYTWSTMWQYFVQVWAIIRFFDSFKRISMVLWAIVITNVLIVGYGMSQLLGADILVDAGLIPDWGSNVFVSTHGNPNFLAGYLIATFPTLIGFWFITRNPVLIVGLPILVILNVYEVIESTARGAYIAVGVFIPLFIIGMAVNFRNLHIVEDAWRKKMFQVAAAVIIIGIVIGGVVKREKFFSLGRLLHDQIYTFVDFNSNYTNQVRLVFFQMAADGALRFPILGRGIGGFNQHMPETRPVWYHRTGVSHNTDHPHNEHLEWLHDTGVLGLSFFWLILVVYGALGLKQIKRHRKGYHFPLLFASFFGPWNQWIQATFDVETRWTGNCVTMWFIVGMVLAFVNLPVILKREELEVADKLAQPVPQKGKKAMRVLQGMSVLYNPSPYLGAVTAVMSLLIVYYAHTAYNFWESDHHLRNNMGFTDGGGSGMTVKDALKEAELARSLCYTNMSGYYKLAYTYLVAGDMPGAMNAYRDLQAFAPNYAQIHINLAFLDDQMGYKTSSAWERDRAAIIEHNTKNHRDAANYWLQLGYPLRALAHLRSCFTIELDRIESGYIFWNDIDNIHSDLARVYASLGRRDEAEKELHQALEINPANIQAAVFMTQLLTENHQTEGVDALLATLEKYSPNNPAVSVMKMTKAMESRNYAAALEYADAAASSLPLPSSGQPSQEASILGNSILQTLQAIFAAKFNIPKTLEIAGWIYATQGRYDEAEKFLQQSFNTTHDAKTGEHLGMVKARRGA